MWSLPNFRRRRYRKDDGHDSPAACSPDAREDGISLFITNAAVNNIARRAEAKNEDEEFLYVRIHPESLEHTAIMSYDEKNPNKGYSSLKKAKRPSKFCWEMSVASRVGFRAMQFPIFSADSCTGTSGFWSDTNEEQTASRSQGEVLVGV
jgi:hypothetical protein